MRSGRQRQRGDEQQRQRGIREPQTRRGPARGTSRLDSDHSRHLLWCSALWGGQSSPDGQNRIGSAKISVPADRSLRGKIHTIASGANCQFRPVCDGISSLRSSVEFAARDAVAVGDSRPPRRYGEATRSSAPRATIPPPCAGRYSLCDERTSRFRERSRHERDECDHSLALNE